VSGHPILDYLGERLWALHPSTLEHLTGLVTRHARGIKLDASEVDEIRSKRADGGDPYPRDPRGYELRGNVAVIPLRGVVAKYAHQVNGSSQPRGIAAETVLRGLRAALADEDVRGIMLNVDSPGGTVSGVSALAEEILASRAEKPIWAHAQDLMASAAYWISSQANRIYAAKAAAIGSIGVYAAIVDQSRAVENEGFRVHVVRAGEHKGVGVGGAPIERADLEQIQKSVDETRELFVEAIADGRAQLELEQVRELATGDTWLAQNALERGLIDGVLSFEETLAALQEHVAGESTAADASDAQGAVDLLGSNREKEMADANQGQEPQVQQSAQPSLEGATMEQLRDANPQLLEQLQKQGAETERRRIAEIRESALPGQEELAEQLIQKGSTPDEARAEFLRDAKGRNAKAAEKLLEDAEEPVGADPRPDQPQGFSEPSAADLEALDDEGIEKRAAADWAAHHKQLQEEGFFSREAYEGHLRSLQARAQDQVL
jgi:signal peptide peptidase SppA